MKVMLQTWTGFGPPFAQADVQGNGYALVMVRRWIMWIPVLRIRVLRHELDHVQDDDFRHPDPVHDRHVCGRSHAWYSVVSSRHLTTSRTTARELARSRTVTTPD